MIDGCNPSCRACSHINLPYYDSLLQKENWLKKVLNNYIDSFEKIKFNPDKRWLYRNKVCLSVDYKNEWIFGLNSRDEIIQTENCPVQSKKVNDSIQIVKKYIPKNENIKLKYYIQSDSQIALIIKTTEFPDINWINDSFKKEMKTIGIEGFWIHLNPSTGKRVLEKNRWFLIFGNKFSKNNKDLYYGVSSFQQLIPELFDNAVNKISDFYNLNEKISIIDLYSGNGSTIMKWESIGCKSIGVELNGEAIECSKLNLKNSLILRGKCNERIPQINKWINDFNIQNDKLLVFTNPPRTGMDIETINWITKSIKPFGIAYLSCSAGTLKKNLQIITENEYEVKKIIPYDFFPNTHHVECLVLLNKI